MLFNERDFSYFFIILPLDFFEIFVNFELTSLRVDPLFQKKKGSTKQRAKACYEISGFLET